MSKERIKKFFNKCAKTWDQDFNRNDNKINIILDYAHVDNKNILDVACGTGVLFDFYKQRHCQFTGIDLSDEMVRIARMKYPDDCIICGDVENYVFDELFDIVMVYNAFPHFLDPVHTIDVLSSLVKDNGYLCIAHSMSRKAIDEHHQYVMDVSISLLDIDELEQLINKYFITETKISNDDMYIITGKKISDY